MGPISPDDLRFNRFGLSQQESRVLALAMTGRIDKQIAAEMGISLGTVRVYWKRIRQKVGGTRSEVIAELARNSLKLDFDNVADRADQLQKELEASMAREQELRLFEAAFESIPTALAILDEPDGKFVRVNPAFAKVHGYEADELEDAPAPSLMKPEDAEAFVRRAKIAENDGKFLDISATRLRKDGTTFAARVVLSGKSGTWVLAVTP
jgi:PAS domain S-box-containing protein